MYKILGEKLDRYKKDIIYKENLISGILSLILLIGWISFLLGFVFAHGVCCADDANIALLAKKISTGNLQIYDNPLGPYILLIIPISILIKLFGSTYWVPGLAVVLLSSVILFLIGFHLRKYQSGLKMTLAVFMSFYLIYVLFSYHFEQWYASLGEVPSGLFLILGALLFSKRKNNQTAFFAGISFSLAFLTKFVSGLGFIALFGLCLIILILDISRKGVCSCISSMNNVIYLVIGFIFPVIVFLVFLLFTNENVTLQGLIDEYIGYFRSHALRGFGFNIIGKRAITRLFIISSRFGVPFYSIVILIIINGLMLKDDHYLSRLFFYLLSILLIYLGYWFFLYLGRARHFVVPLIIIIFMIILPFLSPNHKKWNISYLIIVLLWSSFTWGRVYYPINSLDTHFYNPTDKTRALLKVSKILSNNVRDEMIVTQWDYTVSDIQYISHKELNIISFTSEMNYGPPFWIAVNTKFMNYQDQEFQRLLQGCSGLEEYDGYLVGRCE